MATGRQTHRGFDLESRGVRRLIGIAAIAAIVIGILFAVARPNPFASTKTIWAEFDSVQGLGRIDRDVRVAGVNSGNIGEVKRVGDDALVQLEIEPDIDIHTDARVELRPHTLFEGSGYVDLHPGSPSAPLLEEHATIPLDHTSVYVSLDQATRVLREPIREALADLAEAASETVRGRAITGLQRTLRAAPDLTRELGPTARALQGPRGDELGDSIAGLSATVDALASQSDDLAELPARANRTLDALLVDAGVPLDASLRELPGVFEQLADGGESLTALVDRVDRLAVGLRPAVLELAPALRELRPVVAASIPIARRSLPLVQGLGVVLERAAAAAPELTLVVRALMPGARILDESVQPFLLSDSRLGLPAYLQLISGFSSGTAALRPYQTEAQNPLGAGHAIRLGAFMDSAFLPSLAIPNCATIALLDPVLATELEAVGLCSP